MKIIPTPQAFEKSENLKELKGFSCVQLKIEKDQIIENAINYLKEKFCLSQAGAETLVLVKADDKFFEQKNAKEQGYILTRKDGVITITAQSSIGFFYGIMTLLQLYGNAPAELKICDRPNIRFRGNMNTLWAESGVWSYDFGDGLENAIKRIYQAIDDMVKAKLNLLYFDAFGFACDRFPKYNQTMKSISDYARARGMLTMVGGYTMGYGQSASFHFMGKVFKNKYPYPDGEEYECIGTCNHDENQPVSEVRARTFGTCLTNVDLTNDKIAEICEYMRETGARVLYLHNMDADEIHEPLWLARCERCKKLYPNDSLYAKDGAAGAFAAFYDQLLAGIKAEFPDAVICPISPGYAYHVSCIDSHFEKCRKFWSSVMKYVKTTDGLVPLFREVFVQHDDQRLRFEMIDESMPSYGCLYFSSGDGFYSDKWYTPSGAYAAGMPNADLVICANGISVQKPTQYANAEYLWNQNNSAFYNLDISREYEKMTKHYNDFREGFIRPEGIYGADGLLDRSCELLFGEKYGKRVADIFRIRGKENECPVMTLCNVEIWTNVNKYNLPMMWDNPQEYDQQVIFRERFAESALATYTAKEILEEILENDDLDAPVREHLEFLLKSAGITAKLCRMLKNYMDLYIEADKYFAKGEKPQGDLIERAESVAKEAEAFLAKLKKDDHKPFDIFGGIFTRREELFDFVSYASRQIIKSIKTDKRVPDDRRPINVRHWW